MPAPYLWVLAVISWRLWGACVLEKSAIDVAPPPPPCPHSLVVTLKPKSAVINIWRSRVVSGSAGVAGVTNNNKITPAVSTRGLYPYHMQKL